MPPYGDYPPDHYGRPPYGTVGPPDHQQAILVLILGILGLAMCPVLGPVAWVMGNRVVAEIDASGGQVGGRSTANVGRILGIVETGLMALALVVCIAAVVIVLIGATTA